MQTNLLQYKRNNIQTAPPEKLILLLYSGAIRFLSLAEEGLEEQNIEKVNTNVGKVQNILSELMASLAFEQEEMASSLFQLYEYMHSELTRANIHKDPKKIQSVKKMLTELRDAWKTAAS